MVPMILTRRHFTPVCNSLPLSVSRICGLILMYRMLHRWKDVCDYVNMITLHKTVITVSKQSSKTLFAAGFKKANCHIVYCHMERATQRDAYGSVQLIASKKVRASPVQSASNWILPANTWIWVWIWIQSIVIQAAHQTRAQPNTLTAGLWDPQAKD